MDYSIRSVIKIDVQLLRKCERRDLWYTGKKKKKKGQNTKTLHALSIKTLKNGIEEEIDA